MFSLDLFGWNMIPASPFMSSFSKCRKTLKFSSKMTWIREGLSKSGEMQPRFKPRSFWVWGRFPNHMVHFSNKILIYWVINYTYSIAKLCLQKTLLDDCVQYLEYAHDCRLCSVVQNCTELYSELNTNIHGLRWLQEINKYENIFDTHYVWLPLSWKYSRNKTMASCGLFPFEVWVIFEKKHVFSDVPCLHLISHSSHSNIWFLSQRKCLDLAVTFSIKETSVAMQISVNVTGFFCHCHYTHSKSVYKSQNKSKWYCDINIV